MNKIQEQVLEFHDKYEVNTAHVPSFPSRERQLLRENLIEEELEELRSASISNDLVEVADALGDLAYVVFGAAIEYGIDLETVVNEIHKSNLSKLGLDGKPLYREDGKVIKGPNYEPPDIRTLLIYQGADL